MFFYVALLQFLMNVPDKLVLFDYSSFNVIK